MTGHDTTCALLVRNAACDCSASTVTTSRGLTYRLDTELLHDAVGEDEHEPARVEEDVDQGRGVPPRHDEDAHRAAVAHLEACEEARWAEEEGEVFVPVSPAFGPYCGCTDCQVREVLLAAWPHLRELALELGPEGTEQ